MRIPVNITLLFFCTSVAVAQNDLQTDSNRVSEKVYEAEDKCAVQLIQDIELPALESGKITEILVKPGYRVTPDMHLVQMDDMRAQRMKEEATHRHQIANDRANDETDVRTAEKRYELAYEEYDKMKRLRKTGSMSEQQAERAKVSAEIAWFEHQGAIKRKDLAAVEAAAEMVTLHAAEDSINRHALKSPIDGVVYEVHKDAGEWVTAGETVMKIAQMDRLRIPVRIDGSRIDPHELKRRKVTATYFMANGREITFNGSIVFVDVKKRMGNKYMVWAEVENRFVDNDNENWLLQPGCEVAVCIHLDQPVAKSASSGAVTSTRGRKQ